jgi:hypothetical protein
MSKETLVSRLGRGFGAASALRQKKTRITGIILSIEFIADHR